MITIDSSLDYAQIEEEILGGTTARRGDAVLTHGGGCRVWDADGKRYLDMTSSQGVAMLGHAHPVLAGAIAAQAQRMISCPNFFYNDVRAEFALLLREVLPDSLNHIFLSNSGAEAIDGALKFARLTTGRTRFTAAMRGFHGRTMGALSVTWEPKYRKPFEPLLDADHIPYNNLEKLDAAVTDQTAAVILETVQGEGGVNLGDREFLETAGRLCRERGALLIIDEIQTGFGRTGRWFGFEHFDLQPDIICLAKGLGAGFPMGAIAYNQQVRDALKPGMHGTTFGGNPLACAAGLAAIRTYQNEDLIQQAATRGDLLRARLEEALADCTVVREVRGVGLMVGIELRRKVGPYLKTLMEEQGVLALPAGSNVLRLLPPLIISEAEIEECVRAIREVLCDA